MEELKFDTSAHVSASADGELITDKPQALVKLKPGDDTIVQGFYEHGLGLLKYAQSRIIANIDDMKLATNDLTVIRKVKREIDERRKDYLSPFREHIDEVNAAYKTIMAPVEEADKVTEASMLKYNSDLAERVRAEQEINRKKQELAEDEMNLHGELSQSVDLVEVSPPPSKVVRAGVGTVSQRDNWKYRVVNRDLIPREYLVPDHAALMAAAKQKGEKIVPGVEFYNEPTMARSGK